MASRIRAYLDRVQPSEDVVLVLTAFLIGASTGIGAVILHHMIETVTWFGFEFLPGRLPGDSYVVIVPAVGGLIVGLLVYNFAREAKGHGVPEVMEAVALRGGRIRPIVAVVKSIASAITIGSGGSAGREGPIVQIGSALGSTVGQYLHLSEDRVRNLVACGAAGGIAAAFNAPIAGVLFALEVILGAFDVRYFSTVVISAVVSSVIGRVAFGDLPAFPLPAEYGVSSLWEFALYPLLGIAAALVGVLYIRTLYWVEDIFDEWQGVPEWFKPAVGGALLGVIALAYPLVTGIDWRHAATSEAFTLGLDTVINSQTHAIPHIFNVGYDIIVSALANDLTLFAVVVFMVLKLVATVLTLGSGGSGGVFAPSLFIGAMMGSAFAQVAGDIFPDLIAPPGAYALLGMAALFAASSHAPLTAIIMLMELTDDYRIILPLMLTVIVATLLARKLMNNESIYTLKLTRRGVRLERGRDVDLMQGVLVGEAMRSPAPTIDSNASLFELKSRLRELKRRAVCIINEQGELRGIVTLGDLQRVFEKTINEHPDVLNQLSVSDICTRNPITVYTDDALWTAVKTMGARGIGRLPVLQTGTNKLVGMVSRRDIMDAYNMAVTRKMRDQHRAEQMRLNVLTGAHVFEEHIGNSSPIAGKKIQAIDWPAECIVAAIRRRGKLIVPHGYTVIEPGDDLMIVAEPEAEDTLRQLINNPMVEA